MVLDWFIDSAFIKRYAYNQQQRYRLRELGGTGLRGTLRNRVRPWNLIRIMPVEENQQAAALHPGRFSFPTTVSNLATISAQQRILPAATITVYILTFADKGDHMDIQPIDPSRRTLGGGDYFLLWAGVAVSLAEIWAGGFLAPLGFWTGFWAIVAGHLIGNTFMALGGVIGSDHGIMSMVSVRPAFGIRGSNLAAILNIVQLIGWAAVMLIIGARAGAMLGRSMGGPFASTTFWTVVIGFGTLLWAHFTGRTIWKLLQRAAVIVLLLVISLMTWVSFGQFGDSILSIAPRPMPFMFGLDLVIAMPISWMPLVSDYSRFARKAAPAFWSTWWGYFVISSWMYLLGLAATLVTGETDPGMLILQIMGQIGLALPALAMVVLSTVTTGFPDVYSAACSMLNISARWGARTVLWAAGLLSIAVALVFPMDQYEHFLLFIGAMFVPLFGVVLTDYFLIRRRSLQVGELYKIGGAYWYKAGYNIRALCSWAIGFGLYESIAIFKLPIGGSLPALGISGLVYYLLSRRLPR